MKSYQEFCAANAKRLFSIINEHGSLLKWRKEWSGQGADALPLGSNGFYRGGNLFALYHAQIKNGFKSNQWLTFNQVNKAGGKVLKGSSSEVVYFWSLKDRNETNAGTNETETRKSVVFKTYRVFNLEQTSLFENGEGQGIQYQSEQLLNAFKPVISHYGKHSFFNPAEDAIVLPRPEQFSNPAAYEATLLHELTHWTGVKPRLNRDSLANYGSLKGRAEEELVAEIGAFFLSAFFNIESDIENHASYVQSWQQHLDEKDIMRATNNASMAFHYLVDPLLADDLQQVA